MAASASPLRSTRTSDIGSTFWTLLSHTPPPPPPHLQEIVPPPPIWNSAHGACKNGIGGVLWGLEGFTHLWHARSTPTLACRLVSWDNPRDNWIMG